MFRSDKWLPHMGHPEEAAKAGQSGIVVLIIIVVILLVIILFFIILLITIIILFLIFILIDNDTQVVRSPSILPSPAVSRKKQEGDATMVRICCFCLDFYFNFVSIFISTQLKVRRRGKRTEEERRRPV